MRSTFSARIRKAAALLPALLLACTFMPSAAFADEDAPMPLAGELVGSRTFTLPVSTLSDTTAVTITSGVVELATEEHVSLLADAIPTISTTYVAGGCVYTFDSDANAFTLVNTTNADLTPEGYLVVPSALTLDGTEHPVTAIAAGALSDSRAVLVAFSSNVGTIDSAALTDAAALQAVYVSPDNEAFASYDGCLYDKSLNSLLLIPEGKMGAVRIPSGAEVIDPETFSHCVFVDAISVDAGSAAFSSRNDSLYNADGTQLLRVPAGAKAVTVAPECVSIERAAFLGCTSLRTILVEGDVSLISPEAFSREPETAFEAEEEGESDDPHLGARTNEVVTLVADGLAKADPLAVDPSDVTVVLADEAGASAWELAGFTNIVAASDLTDDELSNLMDPKDETADEPSSDASGEEAPEPIDIDSIQVDESAFAPIVIPTDDNADNDDASAGDAAADGAPNEEGDADSTASPSQPENSSLSESFFTRATAESGTEALPQYKVSFDANGGIEGLVPDEVRTTTSGKLPSILNQYIEDKTPKREKYVFMGFYDGADYTQAHRYYNPDFTQTDCVTGYTFGQSGLVLYAGWAPVISLDVPKNVSVLVGSIPQIDAPEGTTATIKNMSPWPVKATALTWEEGAVEDTAELSDLFENPASLRLTLALASDENEKAQVTPGGTNMQASQLDFISLDAGSVKNPAQKSFVYNLDLDQATVKYPTDLTSSTNLITVFEAQGTAARQATSTVMFDMNANDETGDYYLKPLQLTEGQQVANLTMPNGGTFTAPERYGYNFEGFFDDPAYKAENTTKYFDASGAYVFENDNGERVWNKTYATVLYAGWSTERGTVYFDANGGYFGNNTSTTVLEKNPRYGESVADALGTNAEGELYIPFATYTKPNGQDVYSDEWYTDPVGGTRMTAADFASMVIEDVDTPITFYAHWSGVNATIDVTFYPNGAGAKVNDQEEALTVPIVLGTFAASTPAATREGFTFNGWYTQATGGIEVKTDPPSLGNLKLYAHWLGDEVTVSWNTGGSSIKAPAKAVYRYETGQTIDTGYPAGGAYDAMNRGDGYTWNGWYSKAADGTPSGDRVTNATPIPVEDTTYYAFWNANLTWDYAQEGIEPATTTVAVSTEAPVIVPSDEDLPEVDGYAFDGWYNSDDEPVTEATMVSGPTTFYAHWVGKPCTITLNKNAADARPGTESIEVRQGDVPSDIEPPARSGWFFTGYFDKAADGEGNLYFTKDGIAVRPWETLGNGELFAHWMRLSDYPTFTPDEGSSIQATATNSDNINKTLLSGIYHGSVKWNGVGSVPDASDDVTIDVSYYIPGEGFALNDIAIDFAADGKQLLGFTAPSCGSYIPWERIASGEAFQLQVKGSDLQADAEIPEIALRAGALKAVYADVPPSEGTGVAVTFDANGGEFEELGTDKVVLSSVVGSQLNKPEDPTQFGCTFVGWFTEPGGGSPAPENAVASGTAYYAHWTPLEVTVTLKANGADVTLPTSKIEHVVYGEAMPQVGVRMPSRDGYEFVGFFDTSAPTGGKQYYNAYGESARNWDKMKDADLWARWMEIVEPGPEGPTTVFTPENGGSSIQANASRSTGLYSLLNGAYDGLVTWEGAGDHPEATEQVTVRVDSYRAGEGFSMENALKRFAASDATLVGFEVQSTGWLVKAEDLANGEAFELRIMGSDLKDASAVTDIELNDNVLVAVYSTVPENPDEQTVSITYDANGGVFGDTTKFYATVSSVMGHELSKPDDPTYTGHDFLGWFTQPEGGSPAPSTTVGAATYYAQWELSTYELTLNPMGGTGGTEKVYPDYMAELPTAQMPGRDGFTFEGYFDTAAAVGGHLYYNAHGVPVRPYDIAGNATFYARWVNNETGGVLGGIDPFPEVDPTNPSSGPTMMTTEEQGSPIAGEALKDMDNANSGQVLFGGTYHGYVTWPSAEAAPRADEPVEVVVDAYEPDAANTLDKIAERFAREGKTLLGFQVSSTGSFIDWGDLRDGVAFDFKVMGSNLTAASSVPGLSFRNGTLRAVYRDNDAIPEGKTPLMHQFDACGGTFGAVSIETKLSFAGETLALPSPDPTRQNYIFKGWFTQPIGGTAAPATSPNTKTTYYAHWQGEPVQLNWNINKPTDAAHNVVGAPETPASIEFGKRLSDKYGETLPQPTLKQYHFEGWFTAAEGGDKVTANALIASESTTLYAHWTWAPTTTELTFAANGGSGGPAKQEAVYKGALPTISTKPTRTGYTFAGYYTAPENDKGDEYYSKDLAAQKSTWEHEDETFTLYAHWTANTYEVSFFLSVGSPVAQKVIATYDQPLPTPANYKTPTQEDKGYHFYGWSYNGTKYLNADGTSTNCAIWNRAANTTLVGWWDANTYRVILRNGENATPQSQVVTATYGEPLPTLDKVPTAVGYTYEDYELSIWASMEANGWSSPAEAPEDVLDADGREFYRGKNGYGAWNLPYNNLVLIPYWRPHSTEVKYDFNGGRNSKNETFITKTVSFGYDNYSYSSKTNGLVNENYTFKGFFDKQRGGTQYLDEAGHVTRKWDKDVATATLYAQWEANKTALSFNLNGGTSQPVPPNNLVAYQGQVMPSYTGGLPTKAGQKFNGFWDDLNSPAKKQYYGADLKPVSGRTWDKSDATYTLEADWTPYASALTFDKNGGEGEVPTDLKAVYGKPMPDYTKAKPTKLGYTFDGYYDANGKQYYTAELKSTRNWDKETDSGTILYAHWTAYTSTLTFDKNGGEGNVPSGLVATYGETVPAYTMSKPTLTGNTFLGFYDQPVDGNQFYDANLRGKTWNKATQESTTLYAQWAPISYTVKFNGNGNTSGSAPADKTMKYGESYTIPSCTLAKKGHTFDGWATSPTGGVVYGVTEKLTNLTTENGKTINLYAHYTPNVYTVEFYVGGGISSGSIPLSVRATYGKTMPSLGSSVPEKAGYVFQGIYGNNGTGVVQYYDDKLQPKHTWDQDHDATLIVQFDYAVKPSAKTVNEAGDFYICVGSRSYDTGVAPGYYTVTDIKKAAESISLYGTDSIYYAPYASMMRDMSDAKPTLSSYVYGYSKGWGDSVGGYYFRIIGINHDVLTSSASSSNPKKAGLTFQLVGALNDAYPMNPSSSGVSAGGWGQSMLHAGMNSSNTDFFKNVIPSTIKSNWKQVQKKYGPDYAKSGATDVANSNDYMFLLSWSEIMGSNNLPHSRPGEGYRYWDNVKFLNNEGAQYEYYAYKAGKNGFNNAKANAALVKYKQATATSFESSATVWWLRSCSPNGDGLFLTIEDNGNPESNRFAYDREGVSPCWCF